MKKKRQPLNEPFDMQYTITFSGRTLSDGIATVTSQMIRDKIIYVLQEMIAQGYIREYSVKGEVNNIEQAKRIMEKNKK